ncbi:MAG: hypothetical protein RL264_471 [Bacteroidota bacterium]|jgi:hypothetical protein
MKTKHLIFFPETLKKEASKIYLRLENSEDYRPTLANFFGKNIE